MNVDAEVAKSQVESEVAAFLALAGDHVVSDQDEALGAVVVRCLTERKATLATAESCTGGAIAASITAVPGSSAMFLGSVVAYDNRIKQSLLGVSEAALEAHGAVSEAVVRQMAEGAKERLGTDYAIGHFWGGWTIRWIHRKTGGNRMDGAGGSRRSGVQMLKRWQQPDPQHPKERARSIGLDHSNRKINAMKFPQTVGWLDFLSFLCRPKKQRYEPHMSTHW